MINIVNKTSLKNAFNKIKHEMTDHLQAINENTSEINSNHDYIIHLENMVNKLMERIEELELKISTLSGEKIINSKDFKNITLNNKEKEIFLMLYSRTGDLIDYREISKSLGYTENIARKSVSSMISKGIPIIKKYFDNKVFLILDPDFRNLQAKENIIKF